MANPPCFNRIILSLVKLPYNATKMIYTNKRTNQVILGITKIAIRMNTPINILIPVFLHLFCYSVHLIN